MRVIELTAENFKRLRAVDITPKKHLNVVAGRNAQGKTSVLDAIWHALGGGDASRATKRPIRDGEEQAEVTVDLDDLIVTRAWKRDGGKSTLRVESRDGARYKAPQQVLDTLLGRLSFDPLDFAHQPPRAQRDTLLSVVDLPFDPEKIERERLGLFERRTEINRKVRDLEGRMRDMPKPDPDLPEEELSVAALIEERDAARDKHDERERLEGAREDASMRVIDLKAELEEALAEEQRATTALMANNRSELPDLDALDAKIRDADNTNALVRMQKQRASAKEALRAAQAEADEASRELEQLEVAKRDGLAKAKLPLPGLGFDEEGVTYQGVPFAQASAAEQLRVSMAVAMSLNPDVRVILIRDGSLLDADNMRVIEELAVEHDFQVFIERVGTGDGVGVVIEDGQVQRS